MTNCIVRVGFEIGISCKFSVKKIVLKIFVDETYIVKSVIIIYEYLLNMNIYLIFSDVLLATKAFQPEYLIMAFYSNFELASVFDYVTFDICRLPYFKEKIPY